MRLKLLNMKSVQILLNTRKTRGGILKCQAFRRRGGSNPAIHFAHNNLWCIKLQWKQSFEWGKVHQAWVHLHKHTGHYSNMAVSRVTSSVLLYVVFLCHETCCCFLVIAISISIKLFCAWEKIMRACESGPRQMLKFRQLPTISSLLEASMLPFADALGYI